MGPHQTLQLFGVQLVGLTAENGKKLLISAIFIAGVYLLQRLLRLGLRVLVRDLRSIRVVFWTTQGVQLLTAIVLTIGLLSIWFNDPKTLATALGLVLAGLAFAMQRAVLAFVGYVIILRPGDHHKVTHQNRYFVPYDVVIPSGDDNFHICLHPTEEDENCFFAPADAM